ncbi:hypothetical protein ENSA7_73390 [Enhygromyxa salina]|uniref:Uncharacterized protein n=1 Tax=Enhygromyxa salina TaxID=215803 RepID=A0A2S9XS66_9BACT|nr:hypothetical protein ENSA7_73390 [Enhygromyxa salina]
MQESESLSQYKNHAQTGLRNRTNPHKPDSESPF